MDLAAAIPEDRHAFHIAALTRLTVVGLHIADRIAEAIDAETTPPPPETPAGETADAPPAKPGARRPATRTCERYWNAFNRIAAGIRANIDLEKKLTILHQARQPAPPPPAPPEADPADKSASPLPSYLQNDPAFDDNDLARLGRCWKATVESGKSPFQAPVPLPLPRPRPR